MQQSLTQENQKSVPKRKQPQYFEIHGFKIPITAEGKRVWSPKFKKFIIEKIAKGEFKTKDIAKQCNFNPTLIQQWRYDIKEYTSDELERDERHPPQKSLGFTIPRMKNGKRIWPPELKKLAIEKLHSKEMTAVEIALECKVDSSVVYQWKLEIEKKVKTKTVKSRKPEPSSKLFAEVVNMDTTVPKERSIGQGILLRIQDLEITLPKDYPVSQLALLCRDLVKP